MTEVRDIYPEIEKLELHELHAKKDSILARGAGNYKDLDDDSLAELVAVTRALRKRAAAPGTGGPRKPRASTKKVASLEDLA